MTDRNDPEVNPNVENEADAVPAETDAAASADTGATTPDDESENDATGSTESPVAGAAPRGKSARRSGSGAAAASAPSATENPTTEPDVSSTGSAGRREISFTVTGGGIKKVLAAVVAVALVALVAFLGWRAYDLQREADAFADSKAASADFVTKLVTTLNAANAGNSKDCWARCRRASCAPASSRSVPTPRRTWSR